MTAACPRCEGQYMLIAEGYVEADTAASGQVALPSKLDTNDKLIPYTYPPAHIAFKDGWNTCIDNMRIALAAALNSGHEVKS